MRYNVQSIYFFIRIVFTAGSPRFGNLYLPWEDTLDKIQLMSATCIEHHKVPTEWDAELSNDGFVFSETEGESLGRKWHNQYPRASYGQLDDSNDYRIFPAVLDTKTEDRVEIRNIFDALKSEFGDEWPHFEDVRTTLKRLDRALRQTEPDIISSAPALDEEKKAMLQTLYDQIVGMINEKGYDVANNPTTFEFTNGNPAETVEYIRTITITPTAQWS